jgi:hypothetical protein
MSYTIAVYLPGFVFTTEADTVERARGVAFGMVKDGVWVEQPGHESPGTETFYPTDKIAVVKIYPTPEKEDTKTIQDEQIKKQMDNQKEAIQFLSDMVTILSGDTPLVHAKKERQK